MWGPRPEGFVYTWGLGDTLSPTVDLCSNVSATGQWEQGRAPGPWVGPVGETRTTNINGKGGGLAGGGVLCPKKSNTM